MSGTLSTHVLDAVTGRPAEGVALLLESADAGTWRPVGTASTDADGRVTDVAGTLSPGRYRLTFATGDWFAAAGRETFYPEVAVTFVLGEGHHHVPLLLSPFAYSTYRGS